MTTTLLDTNLRLTEELHSTVSDLEKANTRSRELITTIERLLEENQRLVEQLLANCPSCLPSEQSA